ncbi:UDP-N-acetylmuramoyl-L-alanyl-D-glutamate--2,6-diaminopimelate ligase [Bacillus marinisedimentorum]|uniref:UDP-N-acetylmuramoyl-L-alanyl-D-glutamate--2, 6-diaminopimelate ligase n=1 Tax=Bacillus marinisedimentorum TaxID=1821260 RepID=UPI0008726FA4|nr:UDP-N-acetylmuramoyl-L-alanyl-D-glutamate--2,6-diaminopimelate ligase [Bacillus marinisedimentorum]
MELKELLGHLVLYKYDGEADPVIKSLEMDSREVKPGSLFFCIKGFTVDGHNYVGQAEKNGASAIIAERQVEAGIPVILVRDSRRAMAVLANVFYGYPTAGMNVIGVTGTNGKTTVTHLLENIFRDAGEKTGLIGTIHNKIGDKMYDVTNTTPESLPLQKLFKDMRDEKVDTAIMEVSSHALDLGRVRGIDFSIAIFTNLTQDHLDYHHTMEEYRRSKGLLFTLLGNAYKPDERKIAVLNADDTASEEFMRGTAAQVITYGIDKPADVAAKNIKLKAGGTTFLLETPNESLEISMDLIGKFSVYNVLAAVAAAFGAGVPLAEAAGSISSVRGVAGRFEPVDAGQEFAVIVDYAHTPDSLENVLVTVNQFAEGDVHVIVGCGGDRDRAKRPLMAQIAVKYADKPVFTSDNPRSEDPEAIIRDMEEGVKGYEYVKITDRSEAIKHAVKNAKKGDVVLIAGKGHETYQIIGDRVLDFDDRLVAYDAIKELGGK